MPIVVDSRELIALQRKLDAVSKNTRRDMGRALSSTQRATRTETTRAAADQYTASTRRIGQGTKVSKVDTANLSFTITGTRKTIPLENFKHRFSKRAGITAQVLKSGGAKRIPTAFKVTAGNFGGGGSKARIFQRARLAGGGQVGRLPINALQGPSVADMYANPQLVERVGKFALNKLSTEITRQLEVALRG